MTPDCRQFWRSQLRPAAAFVGYVVAWFLLAVAAAWADGAHSAWRWPFAAGAIAAAWRAAKPTVDLVRGMANHARGHRRQT